ncbi:MAG: hypothetical protein RIC35_03545 [Marinoscillum sp.]
MQKLLPLILCIPVIFTACKSSTNNSADSFENSAPKVKTEVVVYNNPPAEGFNVEESSPIAILLADQVMNSMGGRAAWDKTNVIYWNFFGARTLLWDKENNKVRIDMPNGDLTMALNMDDMTGKVWKAGEEMTNADSLSKYLERAKRMWINDSYWLVMPFKLKDSGVTLTYLAEDTTQAGIKSDVLRLTFEGVGVTPQNAYEVWVDIDEKLIKQWAYYSDAEQAEPNFVLPWTEYKQYGDIKLSGERGDRDLTDIKVLKKTPKGAFDSPEPLDLAN